MNESCCGTTGDCELIRFSSATRTLPFCCEAVATKSGSNGVASVTCVLSLPAICSTWVTRVLTARSRSEGTTVR